MNQEGGLVVCVQVTRRDQKNLLLTLGGIESFASVLRTRRRNFRSLADFFIISSLYSGIHRLNLSFMYFSRLILEACSCLNIVSAKLLSFSGLLSK